jgi:hypothetical protein
LGKLEAPSPGTTSGRDALRGSVLEIGLSSNKCIYAGIGAILILQLGLKYLPFMNARFGSAPLGLATWPKAALAVLIVLSVVWIPAKTFSSWDLDPVSPAMFSASGPRTGEDERYLRAAGDVLEDQIEDVLDVWYGFVGDHPHLIHYFSNPDGADADYLGRVRKRFHQWILDTCR